MGGFMENDTTFVYALYSSKECKIKYIGVTKNPKNRFRQHIKNSDKKNKIKSRWIKNNKGFVKLKILAKFKERGKALDHEKHLIARSVQSGRVLLNIHEGGLNPDHAHKAYESKIWTHNKKCPYKIISSKSRNMFGWSVLRQFDGKFLDRLTEYERLCFELNIAQNFMSAARDDLEEWICGVYEAVNNKYPDLIKVNYVQ